MLLSKIQMKPTNEFSIQELSGWIATNSYGVHKKIWEWFAEEGIQNRDFLYRLERTNRRLTIWTLSKRAPNLNNSIWSVQTRNVNLNLSGGDLLQFSIKVNPVVQRNRKFHDVIMDAKKKSSENPVDREDVVYSWLEKRSERWGVKFSKPIFVKEYSVESFRKNKHRVSISTVDLEGILKVVNPSLFIDQYSKGFGRSKGFGCGLMLVRRA